MDILIILYTFEEINVEKWNISKWEKGCSSYHYFLPVKVGKLITFRKTNDLHGDYQNLKLLSDDVQEESDFEINTDSTQKKNECIQCKKIGSKKEIVKCTECKNDVHTTVIDKIITEKLSKSFTFYRFKS